MSTTFYMVILPNNNDKLDDIQVDLHVLIIYNDFIFINTIYHLKLRLCCVQVLDSITSISCIVFDSPVAIICLHIHWFQTKVRFSNLRVLYSDINSSFTNRVWLINFDGTLTS